MLKCGNHSTTTGNYAITYSDEATGKGGEPGLMGREGCMANSGVVGGGGGQ